MNVTEPEAICATVTRILCLFRTNREVLTFWRIDWPLCSQHASPARSPAGAPEWRFYVDVTSLQLAKMPECRINVISHETLISTTSDALVNVIEIEPIALL